MIVQFAVKEVHAFPPDGKGGFDNTIHYVLEDGSTMDRCCTRPIPSEAEAAAEIEEAKNAGHWLPTSVRGERVK